MTPTLDLRQCRALVAVADHGGPTRAAAALGVSQSTVSEALLALERVVGGPLLARGGARGARTRWTPAGEALLPHARALLGAADAALAAAREAAGAAPLRAALGASESVSSYVLPPLLAALRARWPRAEVQVRSGRCDELRAAVADGRLDAALVLEPAVDRKAGTEAGTDAGAAAGAGADAAVPHARADRGTATVVLGPTRLALIAAPAQAAALAAGRPLSPAALAGAVLYTSDPGDAFHAALVAYFRADGVARPRLRAAGSVDAIKRSVHAAGHAASAGLRWPDGAGGTRDEPIEGLVLGVVAAYAAADEIQAGTLVEVHPARALPAISLKAVLPCGAVPSPVIAALLEALRTIDLRRLGARRSPHAHP